MDSQPTRPAGTPPRVLVVDSDRQSHESLRLALEPVGYVFELALDGRHGLGEFILQPFDVVVLDLTLPDMDGLAVLTEMRRLSAVPIVILTARSALKDIEMSFAFGADDYIKKPFTPEQLVDRLRAATGFPPIRIATGTHGGPRRI